LAGFSGFALTFDLATARPARVVSEEPRRERRAPGRRIAGTGFAAGSPG
jgi:hypothetical protein